LSALHSARSDPAVSGYRHGDHLRVKP